MEYVDMAILGVASVLWILVHFGPAIAGLVMALKVRRAAPQAGALLAFGFCCEIAAALGYLGRPFAGWLILDAGVAGDAWTATEVSASVGILSRIVEFAGFGLIFAGLLGWVRRSRPAPRASDLSGER